MHGTVDLEIRHTCYWYWATLFNSLLRSKCFSHHTLFISLIKILIQPMNALGKPIFFNVLKKESKAILSKAFLQSKFVMVPISFFS